MKKHKYSMASLTFVLTIFLTVFTLVTALAFDEVTPAQLKAKLDADEDIFILDVRRPDEYATGYVPTAYLITLSELEERLDEIPEDKTIFAVCRSGGRSAQASDILENNGFQDVYNVSGGTLGWQALPAHTWTKADDIRNHLETGTSLHIIDVREDVEYKNGHIPGAVSIPLDELELKVDQIPKDIPIIVAAETTEQGDQAASKLIELGYPDVRNLEGGMPAWNHTAMVTVKSKLIIVLAAVKASIASIFK